jgi:hypothetical protein
MTAKPYVGITGPVNAQEVKEICREFSEAGYSLSSPHIPMVGFLASYKTLNGEVTANRRYPAVNMIPDLLRQCGDGVLRMVHYNSKEMETLAGQVSQIFDGVYDDGLCKAMQLNIVWPDIKQVGKVMDRFPDMKIVFQASHKAMADKTPSELTRKIGEYGETVSYVLIDPSGGRGRPFDLENSLAIYSELRDQLPDLTIGFAGGFTGENVAERLRMLIQRTSEDTFCIDAEGGLRDKVTDAYGDDLLNIEKVRAYLQEASSEMK